jgi:hypothetical protein
MQVFKVSISMGRKCVSIQFNVQLKSSMYCAQKTQFDEISTKSYKKSNLRGSGAKMAKKIGNRLPKDLFIRAFRYLRVIRYEVDLLPYDLILIIYGTRTICTQFLRILNILMVKNHLITYCNCTDTFFEKIRGIRSL